jgi:glycosyltransferase involved in cell wall biosynthesis
MLSVVKSINAKTSGSRILWLSFTNLSFSNVVSQLEVSKELARRNREVYLFTIGSKRVNLRVSFGMHVVSIPLKFVPVITPVLYLCVLAFALPFYTLRKRPRYVITEPGTAGLCLVFKGFLHLLKSKVIIDIRSPPIRTINPHSIRTYLSEVSFRVSLLIAKKLDGMTILTQTMRDDICSRFNIDPGFVGVWTSGTSTALFDPKKNNGKDLREKFGLLGDFIVFYHGALSSKRGLVETVKALAILRDGHKDLKLLLLGSGSDALLLKNAARENSVEDRVIIHDRVSYEDVPKYIAICDVGIVPLPNLPEWRFQSPLKLLEYLSMGKTVIATDIPANRDVIGKSKCGILISSVVPQEIAWAISYAKANRANLAEWGSQGRSIVEKDYSWEKVAKDLDNYLQRI